MKTTQNNLLKPLLRGHFHQAAFFFTLGACLMLIEKTYGTRSFLSVLIYTICLTLLFGISTLYHRPNWSQDVRALMRRLDHAAIYLTIAGTGTPVFLMTLNPELSKKILMVTWGATLFGIIQSIFWVNAPKWFNTILYIFVGWLIIPFWNDLKHSIPANISLLMILGGFFYTFGAIIYALKKPNPFPKYFGYHEIFHLLVIIGAFFHFLAINQLININF